jgi:class 3 adenylate cyclase
MMALRATVIMKTDISGSTARFRGLAEADLHALLIEHREVLSRHATTHDGRIVKPEGDGFWLVFPSVTAAALAAMAMQEELRLAQPNKGDDRLVMRVVITLGDVLHEEGALVGDTVVLTARIEAITPPDEIYLSAAAWLAVNQAEIRTAFVDTFPLKGFSDSVPVYRVEQTHRTRVITDQYIVVTDLRGFHRISETAPIVTVEKILEALFELTNRVCRELGGVIRFNAGDSYCMTRDRQPCDGRRRTPQGGLERLRAPREASVSHDRGSAPRDAARVPFLPVRIGYRRCPRSRTRLGRGIGARRRLDLRHWGGSERTGRHCLGKATRGR